MMSTADFASWRDSLLRYMGLCSLLLSWLSSSSSSEWGMELMAWFTNWPSKLSKSYDLSFQFRRTLLNSWLVSHWMIPSMLWQVISVSRMKRNFLMGWLRRAVWRSGWFYLAWPQKNEWKTVQSSSDSASTLDLISWRWKPLNPSKELSSVSWSDRMGRGRIPAANDTRCSKHRSNPDWISAVASSLRPWSSRNAQSNECGRFLISWRIAGRVSDCNRLRAPFQRSLSVSIGSICLEGRLEGRLE